jgi:hypothetical protein
MLRSEVKELHFIAHTENLVSICKRGILCHSAAKKLKPKSIAEQGVQDRRELVVVPGVKKKLHDFANLYFNARNPMMYKRKGAHESLCVLSISHEVLDQPEVIVTDTNASREFVKFDAVRDGLPMLEKELIYAQYWNHDDPIEKYKRSGAICAEVLVPGAIEPRFISAIYVSCEHTRQVIQNRLKDHPLNASIIVRPYLFFQSSEDVTW